VVPFRSDTLVDVIAIDPDDGAVVPVASASGSRGIVSTVDRNGTRALRWDLSGSTFTGDDDITVSLQGGGRVTVAGRVLPAQQSCFAVAAQVTVPTTGVHVLLESGLGLANYEAWCDMDVDGGGWTLAIKVDGSDRRFEFSRPDWTNTTTNNADSPALDQVQAKLRSFSTVALDEVLLGIASLPAGPSPPSRPYRLLRVPVVPSPSLRALFAGPSNVVIPGAPPRDAWIALDPAFRPDIGCNQVTVNSTPSAGPAAQRLRLGLITSGGDSCATPNSWIGIGGDDNNTTAGADNLDINDAPRMAALLVRSHDLRFVGTFASCADVAAAGFHVTALYVVRDTPTVCPFP